MNLWQAVVLGVVQGLTEFLPVSSSAHLILVPHVLGWQDQGLSFDVAAHLGTFLAVLLYFRRDLVALLGGSVRAARGSQVPADREAWRLFWILALGTIPIAVIGFLARHWVETQARNALLIACTSIGFGLLLWIADRFAARRRDLADVTAADGWLVGAMQALAVVPGVSRSGITMTTGLFRGLNREAAARLSFLLFIPASCLVAGKHVLDLAGGKVATGELLPMAIGFVMAFASGILVIGWLLGWLRRRSLAVFAVYRILLGAAILLFWWRGGLG